MPRAPKIRVHYAADRGFLQRLQQAVEKDTDQPAKWTTEVMYHLNKLELLFLDADLRKNATGAKAG